MAWFGIRSIYFLGQKYGGMNIFEERVVCFEASSADEAHVKARLESSTYASDCKIQSYPLHEGYKQDGTPLVDGYEVWSVLFQSTESLPEFVANRYERYRYEIQK